MKRLMVATLLAFMASANTLVLGHSDHGTATSPNSTGDFTYEDLSCSWEDADKTRVTCQAPDGGGFSASCDDLKGVCPAPAAKEEMPATPTQEAPQGSFINTNGDTCQTLQTGTVACTKKDGSIYAATIGGSSASSVVFDGKAEVSIFKTGDGYTCEVTDSHYTVCEKRNEAGQIENSFGTTCDMRPDLCGQSPDLSSSPSTKNKNGAVFPDGNDGLPELEIGLGSTTGQTTQAPAIAPQTNDNRILMTEGAPLANDPLVEQSESSLRLADQAIKEVWRQAKTGAQTLSNIAIAQLNQLSLRVWHAIAHQVTRTQVINRLPARFYASNGIYEKPQPVAIELNLIAENGLPALLRDVSVTEECLGGAAGQASVQHVDMIAQCGQIAFGESRRFKI